MMKRLLDKKGSVLFLVVVVMSILIIAASATFYVVNNQRSSVNVRYSSEQSYQTAVSVSDTVSKYIDGYIVALSKSGKEMGKYKNTIIGKMIAMSTGTSNDITSDIPLDDSMGTAKVTIRKAKTTTKGDDTIHLFEITTDSEVNGEIVTITQVKEIVVGPTEYFTRFLTSTGYHPEDVNITTNEIISATFFENDFTRLSNAVMNDSIYSSGSFYNAGINFSAPTKEIVIAENFYNNHSWGNPVECNEVYVGGNLETTAQMKVNKIYVLGDLAISQTQNAANFYVNGDCVINGNATGSATFYINGNLFLSGNQPQGTFQVKGNVILNGFSNVCVDCQYGGKVIIDGTEQTAGWGGQGISYNGSLGIPFSDADKVSNYIATSTGKQKYDLWDAEKYFVKTFTDLVENVETNPDGSLKKYDIKSDKVIIPGSDVDSYVDGETQSADQHTYFPNTNTAICTITESCVLQGWTDTGFTRTVGESTQTYNCWEGTRQYIVIDTGNKRDDGKELYILLDKGTKPYFSFGAKDTTQFINVLIKGDYPVIFILPNGTEYRATPFMYLGHANLAVDLCGCIDYNTLISAQRSVFNSCGGDSVNKIKSYIKTIPSGTPGVLPTAIIDIGETVTPIGGSPCVVPNFHNNIFFVANSASANIDMKAQSVFYGYVYAPTSKFSINDDGGGNGGNIKFLGGIIVGSYYYKQFGGALAYLTPYDYADVYELQDGDGNPKPADIVKHLIQIANGIGGGGSPDNIIIKPSTGISPTIGYK